MQRLVLCGIAAALLFVSCGAAKADDPAMGADERIIKTLGTTGSNDLDARISNHIKAAEHLEEAAHHHRLSAKYLHDKEEEKAALHTNKAAAHLDRAAEHAKAAAQLSIQQPEAPAPKSLPSSVHRVNTDSTR